MTQIHLRQGTFARLCEQFDCSRDELSRRLSVATSTAYRLDAGQAQPGPKFIGSLLILTGESFEDLFEVVEGEAVA